MYSFVPHKVILDVVWEAHMRDAQEKFDTHKASVGGFIRHERLRHAQKIMKKLLPARTVHVNFPGKAEVTDLTLPLTIQQDIGRFDVSMNEIVLMHILNS